MRGDGRTPRGLRAPQTSSHAAGGTTRSVAPNHGRRAIKKKADPSSDIPKAEHFKRRRHYGRRIPLHPPRQPKRRAASDAIKNPTTSTPHQINLNRYPTRTQDKTGPGSRPQQTPLLQIIPNSKGGKNHNNKKGADGYMDIGGGVPRTKTLPTSTALDFKGWRPRTKMEYFFTKQIKIKGQNEREKIAYSSRKGVLDYINNLTYR